MSSSQVVFLIVPHDAAELLPYASCTWPLVRLTFRVFAHWCQNNKGQIVFWWPPTDYKNHRCSVVFGCGVDLFFVPPDGQKWTGRRRRRKERISLSPAPYGIAGGPERRGAPLGSPSGPKMWETFKDHFFYSHPRHEVQIINVPLWSFCYFKGDENDPDQQSDSEDGSTKLEPQVTDFVCVSVRMTSILILVLMHLFCPHVSPAIVEADQVQ